MRAAPDIVGAAFNLGSRKGCPYTAQAIVGMELPPNPRFRRGIIATTAEVS